MSFAAWAVISIVLAGCSERAGEAKAAGSSTPPAPPVSVAAAIERDVLEADEFPGRVAAIEQVDAVTRARTRKAVLVADRAIGTDQSKRFVLVIGENDTAHYREVKIGRVVGGLRIVESGLEPGEKIVVNGLQRVRPGTAVALQLVSMEGETATDGRAKVANEATLARIFHEAPPFRPRFRFE